MSLVSNQFGIPMVGIQPSASPITTNIQPAPGQPLQGNTLQQIAEALSAFNSGLMGFVQSVVNRDNQTSAEAGAAEDLSRQEDLLKKSWRQIVADTGAPEAANPYYQVELAKNLGRRMAIDAWRQVRTRKESLTDPLNPASLQQVFDDSVSPEMRSQLQGNFYARVGFDEASQRLRVEAENVFDQERMRRMEARAGMEFEAIASTVLVDAAQGRMSEAEAFAQFDVAWSNYNSVVADQASLEKTLLATVDSTLKAMPSESAVDDSVEMIGRLTFQGASVESNIPLMAKIHETAVDAGRLINARLDAKDRETERRAEQAERLILGQGVITSMMRASADGEPMMDVIEREVGRFAEKNKDYGPEVIEALKLRMIGFSRSIEGLADRGRDDEMKLVDFRLRVLGGEFGSLLDLTAAMKEVGFRRGATYESMTDLYFQTQEGSSVAMAAANVAQVSADEAIKMAATMGITEFTPTEAMEYGQSMQLKYLQAQHDFESGRLADEGGRTISEIRTADGPKGVQAALVRILGNIKTKEDEALRVELSNRLEAVRSAGVTSPAVAASATRDDGDLVAGLLGDPASRDDSVEGLIDSARTRLEPLRKAFGFRDFATASWLGMGPYQQTVTPESYRRISQAMLRMEPGSRINSIISQPNDSTVISVSRSNDGDRFIIERRFAESPYGSLSGLGYSTLTLSEVRSSYRSIIASPLASIGIQNVIAGTTGDPSLPLAAFRDTQTGTFPWASVRIFADRDELALYRNDPSVRQRIHESIGIGTSEASIKAFERAQENLLRAVEQFEASTGTKR